MVAGGRGCIGYEQIRSMSGRYASYWNAFLLSNNFVYAVRIIPLTVVCEFPLLKVAEFPKLA